LNENINNFFSAYYRRSFATWIPVAR